MPPESVIEITDLTVQFGKAFAVSGLTLDLRRGELFGLLGPNGAGKSTTVRVLIGQRRPTFGRVSVLGYDVVDEWDRIKPLFGYVPDRDNHFDDFTGRRNLLFFAGLYDVPQDRVLEVLNIVEMTEHADTLVRRYSLGMRKKLMLARALLHDPPILYLDEPTANLDIYSSALVHRILRQRVQQGGTVLLTTHNMEEVEQICDRVAILCKGRLVALDSPLALRQKHAERKVVAYLSNGQQMILDLEIPDQRSQLAELVRVGLVESLQTREFDFHTTFMKLTGTHFE
jgi:ABC-type multidrug transport system ATPase subunit